MKKFILLSIMLGAVSSTIISCGSPPSKATESSSTTDTSVDSEVAANTALYLTVSSTWEPEGSTTTTHARCTINSLAPAGTNTTCAIKIPEGQMYHSYINFKVGTKLNQVCPMLTFKPYVYRISNNDTDYTPNGKTTPALCGTTPDDPSCFGGAMTQFLGASYPEFSFLYFITSAAESDTFVLPPENKIRYYTSKPKKKNFLATNNMPSAARGTGITGKYVAGSMEDYVISCVDLWYHPVYTITLTLSDEDTKGQDGTFDEIEDWQ